METKIGQTFQFQGNRYTYEKVLGEGSFGEVWLATGAEQTVAVKIYKAKVEKFHTWELNALKYITAVCSPYTVCYLGSFIENGYPHIVIEYVNGYSVDKLLNNMSKHVRREKVGIVRDLVEGLNVLHAHGLAHQDIKEANIMYDTELQRFRYLDLGMACLKDYCKHWYGCSAPCGNNTTLYTMAPGYLDAWTSTFPKAKSQDIWAIGVVLLDWYTAKTFTAILGFVDKYGPIFDQSQEDINTAIQDVRNDLAKEILPLLLDKNWKQRNENWPRVVDIVNNYFELNIEAEFEPTTRSKILHSIRSGLRSFGGSKMKHIFDRCDPAIETRVVKDVAMIKKNGGNFWCFTTEEILPTLTEEGTFLNKYTGEIHALKDNRNPNFVAPQKAEDPFQEFVEE